jgi:hypothetical protein
MKADAIKVDFRIPFFSSEVPVIDYNITDW